MTKPMTSDSEELEAHTGDPTKPHSIYPGNCWCNKEAQSEAPSVEDILHDFAVEESLREINLSDKLKRKVITADEYDDRLTEGYRKNLEEAVAKINRLIDDARQQALMEKLSNNLTKGDGK